MSAPRRPEGEYRSAKHEGISVSALRAVRTGSLVLLVALAAGCAHHSRPAPLYLWEDFPKMQYDVLLAHGSGSPEQVEAMEAHAEKARAAGAALPPGFRAHLGMLKLAAGDDRQARRLWEAEKAAFPESTPYMDQLLKRLDASANKDKPA